MIALVHLRFVELVGRLRLARGRCPACASHGAGHADCSVCRAYSGPFPVGRSRLDRWAWRFERELRQRVSVPLHAQTGASQPPALGSLVR
ncbi:MAG: hypothetical protein DCC71_04450 [Proteobacteria bacterium]|nr:MAG: hypothetical protein DCC71_04450 [Pseudomonadota bacterium]